MGVSMTEGQGIADDRWQRMQEKRESQEGQLKAYERQERRAIKEKAEREARQELYMKVQLENQERRADEERLRNVHDRALLKKAIAAPLSVTRVPITVCDI